MVQISIVSYMKEINYMFEKFNEKSLTEDNSVKHRTNMT